MWAVNALKGLCSIYFADAVIAGFERAEGRDKII